MALVEVLPLGGAGEIGRNCTVVIQGDDMIVVDCGISFPSEEMPGVDIVIPDFTFLVENKDKLRAVVLTHAHEDHVGAIPFLLKQIPKVPIYATDFTHAMIRHKMEEKVDIAGTILKHVKAGDRVKLGALEVEFIHVTHSIPDTCAIAVHTEHGVVLFTADFKLDFTPVDGKVTDLGRLTKLGEEGVVLLLSDSTNVDRPGWSPSESTASVGLRQAFVKAPGRVLITQFASNIHRMQQAMDLAAELGRKVAVAGRRMEQTIDVCSKLGYLKVPKGVRIKLDQVNDYEPHEVVILTTGSQGEPLSALVQMSKGEYGRMHIREGDTIIYSARPIPGNEAAIWRTINRLFRLGAVVWYDHNPPVHVSGHGYQEELKMMINLVKPFYLAPVHGEPRHQHHYLEMAAKMGYPEHRVFELHDGQKLILDDTKAWTEEFMSADPILIDAGGKNPVSGEVVREKVTMAEYGLVTLVIRVKNGVAEVETITAHGFSGQDDALRRAGQIADDMLQALDRNGVKDDALIGKTASDAVRTALLRQCNLKPVISPLIVRD